MSVGVKLDWCLRLAPWMRTTPFVALHVSHFGHRFPGSRPVYDVLLIWGRQFMPGNYRSRMKSWTFTMPWRD